MLDRWELTGGQWRVAAHTGDRVTVLLCSCDGEEMSRLESADAELLAYVAGRRSSEE